MKTVREKLRSSSGESLVETLAAILIIAVTIAFLSSSVVTASRINTALKETKLGFKYSNTPYAKDDTITASISLFGGNDTSILKSDSKVDVYKSEIQYYADGDQYNTDQAYVYYKSTKTPK